MQIWGGDPIFAAIEAHRRARSELERCAEIEEPIQDECPADMRKPIGVQVGRLLVWNEAGEEGYEPRLAYTHAAIDRDADRFKATSWTQAQLADVERWRVRKHGELDTLRAPRERWLESSGLNAAALASEAAVAVCTTCIEALYEVQPTTVAGTLALVKHLLEHRRDYCGASNEDFGERTLAHVAESLNPIAA